MADERRLTHTQKLLINELDQIMFEAGIDYWNILDHDPQYDAVRTIVLQAIRRDIVRGIVISQYTLLDEQLGSKVSRYMFDNEKFMKLWRTKKFERFNYFILEKMTLMEKLAFAKEVYAIPKGVAADIESINAIRNALAHAFFPENLRAYRTKHGSAFRNAYVVPLAQGFALVPLTRALFKEVNREATSGDPSGHPLGSMQVLRWEDRQRASTLRHRRTRRDHPGSVRLHAAARRA